MDPEPTLKSVLNFSWAKTKEILFPFEAKRWLRILFIVWLAGHAAGLGGNFNIPQRPRPTPQETRQEKASAAQQGIPGRPQIQEQLDDTQGIPQVTPATSEGVRGGRNVPSLNPPAVALVSMIVVFLALLFLWISSRFSFIFLDLLIDRDVRVRDSFKKHKFLGNSYFGWSLAFIVISVGGLLGLALLIALAAGVAKPLSWLLIPLLVLFGIALGIFGTLVSDFALPIMYQDGIRTMEAFRKLSFLKADLKQVAIYLLVKLGLGIISGILVMLIGFVVLLVALIPGFVIVFLGGLVGSVLPFLKPLLIVFGVLLLICAVIASIVFVGLITLPVPIFFGSFALTYLARLNRNYNLLNFPYSGSSFNPAS